MKRTGVLIIVFSVFLLKNMSLAGDYVPESVQASYRSSIITKAESYLGTPYVLNGSSHSGIDCSGLTMNDYSEAGVVTLPHDAEQQRQLLQYYTTTTRSAGKLFFNVSGGVAGHVGICYSSSQKIHAASPSVCIASYNAQNDLTLRAASWLY